VGGMRHRACLWTNFRIAAVVIGVSAGRASAQSTQAAAADRPDDAPSIRVGAQLYTDYTYNKSPETIDSDGNTIHLSAFNIGRSYINITGNISHVVAFRVTPDVARESGAGSSLNGSYTFRIKYALAQFNLDDWVGRGSWARLGIQETPWVAFEESIYRYRFQGTIFVEREGFLVSADAGASFHYNLPASYGEVHVGVYNGENYNRAEANDRKALQVRGTVRPFAQSSAVVLRGVRAHVFYDADQYVRDAPRRRLVGSVTLEHRYLHAGFEYLGASDQTSVTRAKVDSRGFSIWATPRSPTGWEALLRYDRLTPDTAFDRQIRSRTIAGIAYWFPHQGTVSSALLFDYDGQSFDNFVPAPPRQERIAVHALVSF
jgi:hypothetical protein